MNAKVPPPSCWMFSIALVLATLACPLERAHGATPAPARVGVFIVRGSLMVSGSSSGSVKDADGSVSWHDGYEPMMSTQARYEVRQAGTAAYAGELLDGSSSLSVSGGGSSDFKTKDDSGTRTWSYGFPDNFDPSEPSAGGSFSTEDGTAYASVGYQPPFVLRPEGVPAFTGGDQAALEAYFGVGTGFDFEIPRTIEGWSVSRTHMTNVVASGGGFPRTAHGNATCWVQIQFVPDGLPKWEAILEPGAGSADPLNPPYELWLPIGSRKEASEEPGNGLAVRVFL